MLNSKAYILMLMVLPLLPARASAESQSSSIATSVAKNASSRQALTQAASVSHRASGRLARAANQRLRTCTYFGCGLDLMLGIGF